MDVTDLIHVDVEQDMESVSDVLDILEGGNEEVSRRMATFGERWISSSVLLVTVALATYVVVDTSSLEKGSLSVFKSWLQRITPSRWCKVSLCSSTRTVHGRAFKYYRPVGKKAMLAKECKDSRIM